MIDTDKYEGHSKGDDEVDWRIVGDNFVMNGESPSWRFIAYVEPVNEGAPNVMGFSDADANLIADAPLLLEEVKRLRKQLSKARNWVRDYFTDINGDYTSYENRAIHGDFIQQMEMKKND